MISDHCEPVRRQLQAKIDRPADTSQGTWIDDHLAQCRNCRAEFEKMRQTIGLLHSLPRREPVLDVWTEMQPALAEARREHRMGPLDRLRFRIARFVSNVAEGAIVFTDQVARNTETSMRRFLLRDSFLVEDEA